MTLTRRSVTDLLAAFRSSEPTPGGGSASALAGAVGASLLAMVAGLAKPRTASDDETGRLLAAGTRCTVLAEQLTALIDRDSEAYEMVVRAFRLAKGTEEEKAARTAAIQRGLKTSTEAPLDVMRACAAAMEQAEVVAAFGNRNASSDVQVGLELLAAGLRGAKLNVEINLGGLKDAEYVARVRAEADRLLADVEPRTAAARAALSGG